MIYQRISYFIKAAELLNFSEAARQMYISQQALGKQISLLEEELGDKLFERNTREVELTAFGQRCYNSFIEPLTLLNERLEQMHKLGHAGAHSLRIGLFMALSRRRVISPIVTEILAAYPHNEFEISLRNLNEVKAGILNNELDLCVTVTHDREIGWESCRLVPLVEIPAKIVVSPYHKWFVRDTITSEDLQNEKFVRMAHPMMSEDDFFARMPCRETMVAENYDTMLLELESGRSFTLMCDHIDECFDHGYKSFNLPADPFDYTLMLICKENHPNAALIDEVCALVKDTFEI